MVEKLLSLSRFLSAFAEPQETSCYLMLEDRKITYGFFISKQEVVCANPFGILEYVFLHCLGVSVSWKETKEE